MAVTTATPAIIRTADGVPLKRKLRSVDRARKLRAFGLVAPLMLFITVTFAIPIASMLFRSVDNPELAANLPQTAAALASWNGQDIPDEPVFAALAADFKEAQAKKTAALIGKRLNYEIPGARSKIITTARKISQVAQGPYKQALLDIDATWGKRETWAVIAREVKPFTSFYLLSAVDLQRNADGQLSHVPSDRAIFREIFLRTLIISVTVTLATLVLGYPLAYLLATLPTRTSNLLMILVLLPFWTSLLVRTTAWVVLLQSQGLINDVLVWLHIVDHPLQLIFSRFGTIVAMTHIQLPFTLLPIYSVMKTISPTHVRAARSLGAGPFYAFWRVYFPQTVPGIAAGCLLTFILALGYYITPTLVGGAKDQMVSYFVAYYISEELNWGMASALGAILLVATMVLFLVYNRLVGVDKVKLG
jgi:putative spermidine/putrescine transport system permease protein